MRQFTFFAISGSCGFLIDTGVLYLLKGHLGLYLARAVSFLVATLFTWTFNRHLTFRNRSSQLPPHREFVRYTTMVLGGGGVNYLVYSWLVMHYVTVATNPVFGVAAGSIAGMFVNFLLLKKVIFRFQ